jgi:hypothetical protein
MQPVVIKPVSSRRERKAFLELPWSIYRGDPHWVPPLRIDQAELVNFRPHPFYLRNEIQTFLAYRGDKVCGRVAAILNHGHNHRYQEHRGFFGFFECIDDQEAADRLFDAAREWLGERGIFALRGPTNPSLNYTLGTLVEGFDSPPAFMMTYNPVYYPRLIETYGFRKAQDLFAYWGHVSLMPKIRERFLVIVEQIIEHHQVTIRHLDTSRFQEDVEAFLDVYNRSLTNTWGFAPMSADEVRHAAAGLRLLMVPELAVALEMDGRLVGAAFCLPDYNPRIKQIDGRLFPFGWLRLLRNKAGIKRVRIISTNVLPEYQLLGLGLVLLHGLVPKVMESGIEEAEFSWVLESNRLSRGSLEKGGAKLTKTYRLYDFEP